MGTHTHRQRTVLRKFWYNRLLMCMTCIHASGMAVGEPAAIAIVNSCMPMSSMEAVATVYRLYRWLLYK